LTPYEFICKCWTSEPERFTINPIHHIPGLNTWRMIWHSPAFDPWNTKHLGHAVTSRRRAGLDCSPDLLAHISPLGWAHILLTGEYRWPKRS
ncbi:Tn3 family transposase, partial [Rhodobacter capsulatus]|uniref:Tn3 family transposase n=1 Tax=Rhodobacter capsulatus TaxID=1061 RepID=UPI0011137A44